MLKLTRCGRAFRAVVIGASIGMLGSNGIAIAQDTTPGAVPGSPLTITLSGVDGVELGTATFSETDGVLVIDVSVAGLEPGDHGIHIHETGSCDASGDDPFASAGGHFNPQGVEHGPGPQEPVATPGYSPVSAHAGDLGNITVGDDGTGTLTVETGLVTLAADADNSLADPDGSALVIHENPDDLTTDPSGESGGRIACGVIFPAADGTPAAGTPEEASVAGYQPGDAPVEAQDALVYAPNVIVVSPGDTIEMINTGAMRHDFVVDALGIKMNLPNGELVQITVPDSAAAGEYQFYCSIPGHRPAGMTGTLIVK